MNPPFKAKIEERFWLLLLIIGSAWLANSTIVNPTIGIGLPVGMAGALIGALFIAHYLNRPWHLFALYLFLLAPHVPLMAFLLVQVGLPASTVKAISAWKEITLLLAFTVALWRFSKSKGFITIPDLFALLYSLLTLLYFIFSLLLQSVPIGGLLYGLRDFLLPILLYLVGRSIPLTEKRAQQLFRWLLWAALIYSLFGLIEWAFIPTEWHVGLGIARYYQELLGITYGDYYLGLPENYWRSGAADRLRRAVSVYGSSQSFALSFLLLLPISTYGILTPKLREYRLSIITFLVSFLGLWLSLTRFTIVICMGQLLLATLISSARARKWAWWSVVVMVIGVMIGMIVSQDIRYLVISTITFQDYSSSSRLEIWWATIQTIAQQPFGYGLGVVGQTGGRFLAGKIVVGIEGQFSKVGVELGIQGLLLYMGLLLSLTAYLFVTSTRIFINQPYLKALVFASGLTFLGLFVNALTTEWHNSMALVYPAFWLAGSCVTAAVEKIQESKKRVLDVT